MIFLEPFFNHWLIKSTEDEDLLIGPFESEADAHFVAELIRANKLQFNKGETYGKEISEKPHPIY